MKKRCNRKKAEKFMVKNGVMYYKKKDGVEVCIYYNRAISLSAFLAGKV